MTLEARAKTALKDMFTEIDSVNVENIKLNGITVRAGDKLVRLEVVHEQPITIDDEIREEYRLKLRGKLQEIKTRLNDKINDVVQMTSRIRREAEDKEREMKEKLRHIKAMPEISWNQAKMGVSVVQGETRNEICFLIRGIYYPKFVNEQMIDPIYAKKLIAPIIFFFRTINGRISEFSTRKPQDLAYFPHYHQSRPDCWGDFKFEKHFQDVNQLIAIKNSAEAVLENVNVHSIATSNPRGLPRKATLLRHVIVNTEKTPTKKVKLTTDQIRQGVSDGIRSSENDVWTT